MILLAGLAVMAATVPLAGGSLVRLRDPGFRSSWLLPAALAVQVAITVVLVDVLAAAAGRALHLASYAIVGVWVWRNRHVTGLWLAGFGGTLNLAAIAANGGVMPARPGALATAGLAATSEGFVNSGAVADPRLSLLGDVFAVPAGWPLANVFSIGDILLVVGGGLLLHHLGDSRWAAPVRRLGQGRPRPIAGRVRGPASAADVRAPALD